LIGFEPGERVTGITARKPQTPFVEQPHPSQVIRVDHRGRFHCVDLAEGVVDVELGRERSGRPSVQVRWRTADRCRTQAVKRGRLIRQLASASGLAGIWTNGFYPQVGRVPWDWRFRNGSTAQRKRMTTTTTGSGLHVGEPGARTDRSRLASAQRSDRDRPLRCLTLRRQTLRRSHPSEHAIGWGS
jgi:hypothetical protein